MKTLLERVRMDNVQTTGKNAQKVCQVQKVTEITKLKNCGLTVRLQAPICSSLSKRPKAWTENSFSLGVAAQVSPVAVHFLFFFLLCVP